MQHIKNVAVNTYIVIIKYVTCYVHAASTKNGMFDLFDVVHLVYYDVCFLDRAVDSFATNNTSYLSHQGILCST